MENVEILKTDDFVAKKLKYLCFLTYLNTVQKHKLSTRMSKRNGLIEILSSSSNIVDSIVIFYSIIYFRCVFDHD